jgi:predicted AAA+ superfamily ATPase
MIGAVWETFVLNQLIRHQQYTRTAAKLFYFRDTHGTEVDFLIDQNGRVRLMEAKWAENPDAADAKQIVKVRGWLGALAADEHWIACRTSHEHLLANPPGVRAIDAWRKRDWFLNSD